MPHPLIEEHLPVLAALEETLDRLDGREVKVKVDKNRPEDDDDDRFADRVHRALLRKKRSGSLGLGD